eukprot:scaffold6899_cov183-Amphora_coffeaeformis.AAC.12
MSVMYGMIPAASNCMARTDVLSHQFVNGDAGHVWKDSPSPGRHYGSYKAAESKTTEQHEICRETVDCERADTQ